MKEACDFNTWWSWFSQGPVYDEELPPKDVAAEAFKAGWEWANEVSEW